MNADALWDGTCRVERQEDRALEGRFNFWLNRWDAVVRVNIFNLARLEEVLDRRTRCRSWGASPGTLGLGVYRNFDVVLVGRNNLGHSRHFYYKL